jgi:hypothetical protein
MNDQPDPTLEPGEIHAVALDRLDHLRATEPEFRGQDPQTVRDIVLERPTTRRCLRGPIYSAVSTASVRNHRGTCQGMKCPHCVNYRLPAATIEILHPWGNLSHVYVRRTSRAEWKRRTTANRQLREAHPLRCQVNLYNADDDVILISPDPMPGSVRHPAVEAVVDALLETHYAPGRGKGRFQFPQTEAVKAARATEESEEPKDVLRTRVASRYTKVSEVNHRYDAALRDGKAWVTELPRRGTHFSRADERAITPAQHPTAVEVLGEFRQERLEELEQMRNPRRYEIDPEMDAVIQQLSRRAG